MAQWTSQPIDSRMYGVGGEWALTSPAPRNAIPGPPVLSSDIAHRPMHRGQGRDFATTSDQEHAAQERRQEALVARRQAQEERVMAMVANRPQYDAALRSERREEAARSVSDVRVRQHQEQQRRASEERVEGLHYQLQSDLIQQQASARRTAAQQVAREQLAQMEARKAAQASERAAERAFMQTENNSFGSRFGSSLV